MHVTERIERQTRAESPERAETPEAAEKAERAERAESETLELHILVHVTESCYVIFICACLEEFIGKIDYI